MFGFLRKLWGGKDKPSRPYAVPSLKELAFFTKVEERAMRKDPPEEDDPSSLQGFILPDPLGKLGRK